MVHCVWMLICSRFKMTASSFFESYHFHVSYPFMLFTVPNAYEHYVIGQTWKNDQQMRDDSPKLLLSDSGFCLSLWQPIWMRVSANIHNVPVQCAMCTLFCSDFIVLLNNFLINSEKNSDDSLMDRCFFYSLEASGNFEQIHDIEIFDTILRNDRLLPLHCYNSLLNICMLLHIWMKALNFHINRIFDHWPSSNSSTPLSISLIVILQIVCHFTSNYGILKYFFLSKIWLYSLIALFKSDQILVTFVTK